MPTFQSVTYKILFLVFLVFTVNVFGQKFIHTIPSQKVFDTFSGLPLSDKYGQISSIKVVFHNQQHKLYYINSHDFRYHYTFCNQILGYRFDLGRFNLNNYSNSPQREFLIGNLNYYRASNRYVLELFPGDQMPPETIQFFYSEVVKSGFWKDSLYFFINSTRMQNLSSQIQSIRCITPDEIFKGQRYQAVSKQSAIGNIHVIQNLSKEIHTIKPTDIIVINETPMQLPIVAGVIVNQFQTPLSHLSILGQNRKIPIMAYTKAYDDSLILDLNNKQVLLQVESDTFRVKLDSSIIRKRKFEKINISSNLSVDTIIGIEYLKNYSQSYVGNKAANFGILYDLSKKAKFKVPEHAFAIPFYFYHQHALRSGANMLIDKLLSDSSLRMNQDSLEVYLQLIQKAIMQFPLDSNLSKSVRQRMLQDTGFANFRFRSSTNAEDAKGFSGAGLYTSKSGSLNNLKKTPEKAILQVWASLWSIQAYNEREYYGIPHNAIYMGILAHRSFPDEAINGVAITKNVFRDNLPGFYINAQKGNENVVNPKQGVICDQFICYPKNTINTLHDSGTIEIITLSSLGTGTLLMSEEEIKHLANQLEIIKKYFYAHEQTEKIYEDFGLDIEFKIDIKNRQLYIKQVRLYND